MTASVPVFVYADDPALDRAVLHALAQEDGITAVSSADGASWLVVTTSLAGLGWALLRSGSEPSPLTPREEAVLRLVAEGYATAEIAARLSYSERSIKNVIQAVTERLALRNRCHAVAHAIRKGWI